MNISKDLFFTGINQFWKILSGPVLLIFIPLFLSPQIQGYWFTFISVSAMAIFADLGFTNIVLQFSAHEFAYLRFNEKFEAEGSELHLKRLASFFRFVAKWCAMMIGLTFPIILGAGFFLFLKKGEGNFWIIPWMLYVAGSALNFFNNTLLSFFEGCGQVALVQRIRFVVSMCNTTIIILMMYFNCGLYALAVSIIISSSLILIFIRSKFEKFIFQLLSISKTSFYSWRKSFLQLFWKFALSFASGYFIFQLYTPLMFYFHGSEQAGKVGLSMALWTAAYSMSNVWMYAITPRINMLVSKKDWSNLDLIFKKSLLLSLATYIFGASLFFSVYFLFKGYIPVVDKIIERFLPPVAMLTLAIAWFFQILINGYALYLRAHKEEPFMIISLISAVYISVLTYFSGRYLNAEYIFTGFLSAFLWTVPWTSYIFITRRKKWHQLPG